MNIYRILNKIKTKIPESERDLEGSGNDRPNEDDGKKDCRETETAAGFF